MKHTRICNPNQNHNPGTYLLQTKLCEVIKLIQPFD